MEPTEDDVHGTATYDPKKRELTVHRRYSTGRPDLTTVYSVTWLPEPVELGHPEEGCPALRLTQADGTSYDVLHASHGWQCECFDFRGRRQKLGHWCKHIKAVVRGGVLNHPPDRGDAWEGDE